MIKGKLYIVSAPSGTGKSSLIRALKTELSYNTQISVSYTTRAMRFGEKNGDHYYFITESKFIQMIKNNDFLEYACILGNYYGTSRMNIEKFINRGVNVFLDIDWQGAKKIRQTMLHFSVSSIFILPPSKTELLRRLRNRGQDNQETIEQRLKYTTAEMRHYHEYDYIIINDEFKTALEDLHSIVRSESLISGYQIQKSQKLINKLLAE